MSEPYDCGECPACGSQNTGCYSARSTALQGFGARCYACGAVWQFPTTTDPAMPAARSFADLIWCPPLTGYSPQRGDQ